MAAKDKTAADTAAPTAAYIVAIGVIEGPADPKTKAKKVWTVGDGFDPSDDAEAEALVKSGRIVPRDEYIAKVGGAPVAAALATANERADAAEARAAELQKQLDALAAKSAT